MHIIYMCVRGFTLKFVSLVIKNLDVFSAKNSETQFQKTNFEKELELCQTFVLFVIFPFPILSTENRLVPIGYSKKV